MKKSELRAMIRDVLKEELKRNNHKKLRESANPDNRLPWDGLDELVASFNSDYGRAAGYAQITEVACVWETNPNDPDIELVLSESIDEEVKNYILIKLFADFVRDIEFDELLEFSWLNENKTAIRFWFGRLENIGINTDGLADYDAW